MYLFYNFCTNLHVSKGHFVHHQEFMIYCILQLCTNHVNVSTDSSVKPCKCVYRQFCTNHANVSTNMLAWFVQSC